MGPVCGELRVDVCCAQLLGERNGGCQNGLACQTNGSWLLAESRWPGMLSSAVHARLSSHLHELSFVCLLPVPSVPSVFLCLQRLPERILEKCVKGMLPKGRIASPLFNHLKVYKGAAHPHEAQRPLDITSRISKKASESL